MPSYVAFLRAVNVGGRFVKMAELRAVVEAVDGVPPLLEGAAKRYVALADARVPVQAAAELDAWDRPGERARALGWEMLAELTVPFHRSTLTNARIERITGRTTTWRDLTVIRALDERWGA